MKELFTYIVLTSLAGATIVQGFRISSLNDRISSMHVTDDLGSVLSDRISTLDERVDLWSGQIREIRNQINKPLPPSPKNQ